MATTSPRRIIIDTDPGVDDALAILLLLGSSNVDVKGITIAPGNHRDSRVLGANAKLLLRLAGLDGQVPVCLAGPDESGVVEPDEQQLQTLLMVHGEDGMGGVTSRYGRTDEDLQGFHELPACDFIHQECSKVAGEVSLVCIAPLTNLAAAVRKHPDLPKLVKEVVVMGGALREPRGNRTPASEANFTDDPEAAQTVLSAGFEKLLLADLAMTHQTDIGKLQLACSRLNSIVARFVQEVCEGYIKTYLEKFKKPYAPAHDVVAAMHILHPEMFDTQDLRVEVETKGEHTRGMSIADWYGQWKRPTNCTVMMSLREPEAFVQKFLDVISSLPRRPQPMP